MMYTNSETEQSILKSIYMYVCAQKTSFSRPEVMLRSLGDCGFFILVGLVKKDFKGQSIPLATTR